MEIVVLVSDYELDHFFHRADEQMSRMASVIPGRESSFSEHYLYSPLGFVFTDRESETGDLTRFLVDE